MKKINKFCVLQVRMEGFKRFKEEYVADLDRLTYISGGNGQGKTTIADAIAYAFCGTPFWGEKSIDRLQNNESKEMQVSVRFVDEDGEVHNIVRKRCGNNTTVTLDTQVVRQVDLVNIFAEKDVFLSILNPLYFIEKIAEDGREFLQKLLPSVEQTEVLQSLSESTAKLLEGESLQDPEYYIKNKRESLKDAAETCTYLEGQIDALKKQGQELETKLDAIIDRGNRIVAAKITLEEKQFKGIDVEALRKKQAEISQSLSEDTRSKLLARQAEAQNRQYESKFAAEIVKLKAEIDSLSAKCKSIAEKAKSIKVGDTCPVCHTVVTAENHSRILAGLKAEYESVRAMGQSKADAYRELVELDKKSKAKFEEFRQNDLQRIAKELAELGEGDVSDIAMLEDKIRLGNLTEEEYANLRELTKQADAYTREVELLCDGDKIPAKIKEAEEKLKGQAELRKNLQNLIRAATEFAAKKAELSLKQLAMNHASIKLFDVAKTTGEIKNVFRFTYDGKDYRWLSTSEKVKAGLEVSRLLKNLTGYVYPTYIDNAECITTKLEPVQGQVVLAYAKGTELTIQCPLRDTVEMKEAA